jgi:hypothetical protein
VGILQGFLMILAVLWPLNKNGLCHLKFEFPASDTRYKIATTYYGSFLLLYMSVCLSVCPSVRHKTCPDFYSNTIV